MDRHHVDADQDPNPSFHVNADPDPDPYWQQTMPILSCGTPSSTHVGKSVYNVLSL